MVDISTEYLGLKLQSPIIAGSSGLTNTVDNLKKMADNGAGAVVLKSIFEEEVAYEYADFIASSRKPGADPHHFDYDGHKNPIEYYDYVIREENLKKNITLVEESKKGYAKNVRKWLEVSEISTAMRMAGHIDGMTD